MADRMSTVSSDPIMVDNLFTDFGFLAYSHVIRPLVPNLRNHPHRVFNSIIFNSFIFARKTLI